MQGRTLNEAVRGATIEPGKYMARLKAVTIWTKDTYDKTAVEPMVKFHWEILTDEDPIRFTDNFIPIRRDREGYPIFTGTDKDKFYNRVSACYGARFDPKTTPWSMQAENPRWEITGVDDLLNFPHWEEGKQEGFKPVYLKEIVVDSKNIIGEEAEIELVADGQYTNCIGASFKAKLPSMRRPTAPTRPARQELETVEVPA